MKVAQLLSYLSIDDYVWSADELEYWVRDPKFDVRRFMVDGTDKPKTKHKATVKLSSVTTIKVAATTASTKKPPQVKHQPPAKNATSQAKTQPKAKDATTTTKKITVTTKKVNPKTNKAIIRSGTSTSHRSSAHETVFPRANTRHRYIDEQENKVRSTKVYLMGQTNEDITKTTQKPPEDTGDDILNPYTIRTQLEQVARNFSGANITFEVIGQTIEYNNLILMKAAERISNGYFRADGSKYVDEVPDKKIVFIVHGLSVKGIKMLPCLRKVKELQKLIGYYYAHLDKFDIFLIPLANPDGVLVTLPIWNKNASPQNACRGVALDRNFDVAWNTSTTMNSCSQQYPGAVPFSEPETKAIREIFHRYGHKIIAYINVHAGMYDASNYQGEAVLYPNGYTDTTSDDDKYVDLRGEIDEAMRNASLDLTTVAVETLHSRYGKVIGTSVDYASTIYGIQYALEFVMQLYDGNVYGPIALSKVWRRTIDVIFNNIWRNSKNDV